MKRLVRKILLLQRLDCLLIFRRKLFWIVIPGLLTGLLAVIIVPDFGGSNVASLNGHGANLTQRLPTVPKVENSQPSRLPFISLAIIVGLVIGVGLALFLELKDGSVRSEIELARLTKIPVLTSIPFIQDHESTLPEDRSRV